MKHFRTTFFNLIDVIGIKKLPRKATEEELKADREEYNFVDESGTPVKFLGRAFECYRRGRGGDGAKTIHVAYASGDYGFIDEDIFIRANPGAKIEKMCLAYPPPWWKKKIKE